MRYHQIRRLFMLIGPAIMRRSYATSGKPPIQDVKLNDKIPPRPTWKDIDRNCLPKQGQVDDATIELLERLSLVDFSNQAGMDRLMEAISLADTLQVVDIAGVEPMESVLEDRELRLREDEVTEGNCREEVMKNATKTFEDYFVAPPGNIPLETKPASRYLEPQQDGSDEDGR